MISDGTMLKLFENYQFTFEKQVLPEMSPVGKFLDPEGKAENQAKFTIDIRLVAFD
jgi:hypothetical protein